jgi:selenocysteine lyase/cysteine desulfurase
MFALGASVEMITNLGIKNIEARALALNRVLTDRLQESGWQVLSPLSDERMRSAETLVQADDPAGVVAKLAEQKIIVTQKPQGIRVATHFFNNEEDVDRLVGALAEV